MREKRAWISGDNEDPDGGPSQANSKKPRSELPTPMNPIHIKSNTESDTTTEDTTKHLLSSKTKVQWKNPWKASSPQQLHAAETLAQMWKRYTNPPTIFTDGGYYNIKLKEEEKNYFTKNLYNDIQKAPTLLQPGSDIKPSLVPHQRIPAPQVVPILRNILRSAAATTKS